MVSQALFGVRDLAVFGSVARGDASDASDLDVLVDFVGSATFDGYMGLKLFLEDSQRKRGARIILEGRAISHERAAITVDGRVRQAEGSSDDRGWTRESRRRTGG